ncbi:MAG: hypothetical protein QOJ29_1386 [Thermoleophilaceae bacterium]|nr:hypothetical protein [Thermoleophilaceae bacterium]
MALRRVVAVACVLAAVGAAPASATNAPIVVVAGGGHDALPASGQGATKPATSVALGGPELLSRVPQAQGGGFLLGDASWRALFVTGDGNVRVVTGSGTPGAAPLAPYDMNNAPPAGSAFVDMSVLTAASFWAATGSAPPDDLQFLVSDKNNGRIVFVQGRGASTWATGIDQPFDAEREGASSNWLMADWGGAVVRENGTVIAGNGSSSGAAPASGGSPVSGSIGYPHDVSYNPAADTAGATRFYYVASRTDTFGGRVWKVTKPPGSGDVIERVASAVVLGALGGVQALRDGGALVYGGDGHIYRASSAGALSTIAGAAAGATSPQGTPADQMTLNVSGFVTVGEEGVYVSQPSSLLVFLIPATAITSGPGPIATPQAEFGITSWDQGASYSCMLDGITKPSCGPFGPSDLADGSHILSVAATTDSGALADPTPSTWSWTVDGSSPPAPALSEPVADGAVGDRPTFTWQPEADTGPAGIDHFEVFIDEAKVGEVETCAAACAFTQPTALKDGQHKLRVKVLDKAGNFAESTRRFAVASAPAAAVSVAPTRVLTDHAVTFDASGSTDDNGQIVRYEWDLDGDGSFEVDGGAGPATTRTYGTPQSLMVQVRVTDDGGLSSTASASLVVTSLPPAGKPLGVSINDGAQYTNDPNVTVFAVWPTFASNALVSNDGGFKNAVGFPVAETIMWKLDSSGPERLPKTIYVRFVGGSQTSETYQDDIILDQTPPKLTEAQIAGAQPKGASAAKAMKVTLRLKAKDNVSGVGAAQVTKTKKKPGKLIKYKATLKVVAGKKLYVRVRDRAGNFSAWRTAKRR